MIGGLAFVIDDEDWLDGGAGGVPEHMQSPKLCNTEAVTVSRLSVANK
jgi:hypothetical protein